MKKIFLFGFILLFISFKIFCQQTNGNIQGRVIDESGLGKSNVNILLFGTTIQGNRGTTSDADGYFRLLAVPPGIYSLSISYLTSIPLEINDVLVKIGNTTNLGTIILNSKVLELSDVLVLDKKSLIDPVTTKTGENISHSTFDQLPVNRAYQSISLLAPHVSAGLAGEPANICGSSGLENIYYVDGINITDPSDAATSTRIPYNFIKEIEIKTGGYEAEYGKALGGIINVITPSGSNDLHINAFGFYTGNKFSASPKPGLSQTTVPSFGEYDFGGALSGALIKDKLWFFAAYNPGFKNETISLAELGERTKKETSHLFAGKLTWQVDKNTNIVFNVLADPRISHQIITDDIGEFTVVNYDALMEKRKFGGINASVSLHKIIGDNFLLNAKAFYLSQQETTEPETKIGKTEPLLVDYYTSTISGGRPITQDDNYSRTGINVDGSLFIGDHSLKTGISFEDNFYQIDINNISPLSWIIRTGEDSYISQYLSYKGKVSNRVLSLYLQDSWKVNEYLRLNAGLRWDGQYFIGENGNVVQSINDQFQPRIGIVFTLGTNSRSKIFGFWGRFYEQIPSRFLSFYYLNREEVITVFDHNPIDNPSGGLVNDLSSPAQTEIVDLEGEYFDEFILGYEQILPSSYKVTVRGIYREVGQVIDDFIDPATGTYVIGNPGKGNLSILPRLTRIYKAVELSLQKIEPGNYGYFVSYVLSKTNGNYTGIFNPYQGDFLPNSNFIPDIKEQYVNSDGLLPNDRTHVFKVSGFYNAGYGITLGANIIWQSGTPLTEYGADPYGLVLPVFVNQRGSAERTPAIINVDLRMKYELTSLIITSYKMNLVIDVFNLFNSIKAVVYDEQHYLGTDENGEQTYPNANYMKAIRFSSPRMVRLGLELEI